MFTQSQIEELTLAVKVLPSRHSDMLLKLAIVQQQGLKAARAKEYLMQGVGRRFRIVYHCIMKLNSIFPPSRKGELTDEELIELSICLHAFYMNVFGLLDNLAWVIVHERGLSNQIRRTQVGLYSTEMQKHLDSGLTDFLNTPRMTKWHNEHLKDYRDALAHRIPLYVPPYAYNVNNGQTSAYPAFSHSLDPNEQSKAMVLHPQVLADFNSIYAIMEKLFENELGISDAAVNGFVSKPVRDIFTSCWN